jgi:hypothetical protein
MFAIDHVLVSDDLIDAAFACDLGACHGACCVQGEAGAPLVRSELAGLERVVPSVEHLLTDEARAVIAERGPWEETFPGRLNTTCVPAGPCVFVTYEGPVAKCAIERAFREGRTDVHKPQSCHLYPVRIECYDEMEVLNYEQIPLCVGGRQRGGRLGILLADFLREPLARRYGDDWYARFRSHVAQKRAQKGLPDPHAD